MARSTLTRFLATALAVLALGLVVLGAGAPARASAAGCPGASAHLAHSTRATLDRATLCLLNRERARHGLGPFRLNARLSLAAGRHSRDMVVRHYFAHDSLGGTSFIKRILGTGYLRGARSWSAAENIAWGSGGFGTPEATVRGWMASPGHRANILGPYREIGIGIRRGAPVGSFGDAATYTTDFGRR